MVGRLVYQSFTRSGARLAALKLCLTSRSSVAFSQCRLYSQQQNDSDKNERTRQKVLIEQDRLISFLSDSSSSSAISKGGQGSSSSSSSGLYSDELINKILSKDTFRTGSKANTAFSGSNGPRPAKSIENDYSVNEIKRTGTLAGRSVTLGTMSLNMALSRLNSMNQINKVRRVLSLQRYHERPGKVRLRLRNEKAKRDFNKGIRRLFDLVNEARRKGY